MQSSGYVKRASRRRLPAARLAGNRVKAADGASFVVFIFLGSNHGKLYTWKRRLGAFSGNSFLFIFYTNVFSEIPRYAT
jgi:hypothetical protein